MRSSTTTRRWRRALTVLGPVALRDHRSAAGHRGGGSGPAGDLGGGRGSGGPAGHADHRPARRPAQPLPPESFSAKRARTAAVGPGRPGPVRRAGAELRARRLAGRPARFPEGARGIGTFLLAQPPSTRSALVVDAGPPAVSAPLQQGPTATLRALTTVRPQGGRATSEALDLAVRELPPGTADPRLVVLYTGAPDAGGEPAVDSRQPPARRGRTAVRGGRGGATGSPCRSIWSTVAAATGGVAVAAPPGQAVAAFDRLATALRSRYLMRFPVPSGPSGERGDPRRAPRPERSAPRSSIPAETSVAARRARVAASAPAAMAAHPLGARPRGCRSASGCWCSIGFVAVRAPRTRRRTGPATTAGTGGAPAASAAGPAGPWNIPARLGADRRPRPAAGAVRSALDAGERALLHAPDGHVGVGTTTAMIEFAHRYRDHYDIAWRISAAGSGARPGPDGGARRGARPRRSHRRRGARHGPAARGPVPSEAVAAGLRRRGEPARAGAVPARGIRRRRGDLPGTGWRECAVPVLVEAFTEDRVGRAAALAAALPAPPRRPTCVGGALDDLPLAVGPAASMLADTGMSVRSYLRQLSDRREKLRLTNNRRR